ncbi:MAG: ribosomal protein S18-alanine N-acetyltransferase [Pseudomonadales bacterium]|jgi:ribosomal-protein-alanine N-acetyltransferase
MIHKRLMQREDLEQVVANELLSYAFPWTHGIFENCLTARHECWVACLEENLVGHGVISVGGGEGHLLNLCVRRDLQGNGYGRQLALHMMNRAHVRGASALFLEVRPSNMVAGNLYESLGFREVGKRKNYYPSHVGHEDARVLALNLDEYYLESGADADEQV